MTGQYGNIDSNGLYQFNSPQYTYGESVTETEETVEEEYDQEGNLVRKTTRKVTTTRTPNNYYPSYPSAPYIQY
jgi:YD repeat-containing protein